MLADDSGAILEPLCLNVNAEGLLEVTPLPQLLKLLKKKGENVLEEVKYRLE